jgi:hypothetical protein
MPTTPFPCSADASALKGADGTNYSSDWNGTGYMTPIGVSPSGTYVFRGLMHFNTFSTSGMTNITSATLQLKYYHSGTSANNAVNSGNSSNRTVYVYLAPSSFVNAGAGSNFPATGWTNYSPYTYEAKCTGYLTTPSASYLVSGTKSDGASINIDVTSLMQYVLANPTFTFRGFVLRIDDEAASSTSSCVQFYAIDSSTSANDPVLSVTYNSNTAPNAPINLSPTGGGFTTSKTLYADFSDPDTGDELSGYQVQISTSSAFSTILYDSGEVADTGTAFGHTYTASLTYNTVYYWRARTKDLAGLWGPYSDGTASFKPNTKPNTPSNLTPSGGSIVSSLTPTFSGSSSDPDSGDYLAYARIKVYRSSDSRLEWDSGDFASGVASFTKTFGSGGTVYNNLSLNTTYYWTATVKDSNGASSSTSSSATFTTYASGVGDMTPSVTKGTGWVKTLTPSFNFVTPVNMNQYWIRLYDTNGTLIRTIGPTAVSPVATTLATAYVYSGAPALEWGTRYQWTAQFRDTNNVTQTESAKEVFWTNAAPASNNIYPANNQAITSINPSIEVGFNDQDLGNGFSDSPTALSVEVSRSSDSLVMYTMTKSSSLSSVSNALAQGASGVTGTASATVTGVVGAAGIVTYTCAAGHPFSAGQVVTMTGINPTAYNLTNATVLGSPNAPTATTFKVSNATTTAFVSGGTATSTGTITLEKNVQYRYRSRYTDNSTAANAVGPYTDYVYFKPTDGPTIAYKTTGGYTSGVADSDLTTGKLNNALPELSYTYTGAYSKTQKSRRLRVIETSASNAIRYDSGFVLTSDTTLSVPADVVLNNATYSFEITVADTDDIVSSTISTSFVALWNAPAQITGLDVQQGNGTLKLSWDTSSDANFTKYNIYRETFGAGEEYTLLATITDKATVNYTDFSAGVGVKYEYKITQTSQPSGSNPVDSDIDAAFAVTASSESDNWWIVYDRDDNYGVELYVDSESRTNPYQEEVFEPFGRSRKVIVRYTQYGVEGSFSAYIPDDEAAVKMPKLKALFAITNTPLYIKTPFGDVYKAYLGTPTYEYSTGGTVKLSVSYIEVD